MKEPPADWALTEEQYTIWRAFLFSTQHVMGELDRRLQAEAGIPHTWYGILAALSEQPERTMKQSDLAGTADFSLSRLSHAMNRLEQRGWVRREAHPQDGRATNAVLTDLGFAALAAAAPGHVAAVRELVFAPLTPVQAHALGAICTAMMTRSVSQPVTHPVDPGPLQDQREDGDACAS